MKHQFAPLFAFLALAGSACGLEVSQTIAADEGGRITLRDSVLEIPAAALPSDTAVSMRLESIDGFAPLADASDDVLTIEPASIALAVAGTLTLDLGGPVAAGESVVAHHLLDGAWSALATEALPSGLVQASISALGSYALTRRAQGAAGNRIAGFLRWADGSPVVEAPVQLHQGGARLTETITDADGAFAFADLAAGEYQLVVSHECELAETVTLANGAPLDVELALCSF